LAVNLGQRSNISREILRLPFTASGRRFRSFKIQIQTKEIQGKYSIIMEIHIQSNQFQNKENPDPIRFTSGTSKADP
jgi:hypothetical protein